MLYSQINCITVAITLQMGTPALKHPNFDVKVSPNIDIKLKSSQFGLLGNTQ